MEWLTRATRISLEQRDDVVRALENVRDWLRDTSECDGNGCEVDDCSCTCDVRLQWVNGAVYVHSGDASYDTDHRGYWGASSVGADYCDRALHDVAEDLISQAEDHAAQ